MPTPNNKRPGKLKTDKLKTAGNIGARGTEYLEAELGSAFGWKTAEEMVETHSELQIGRKFGLDIGGLRWVTHSC